MSIEVTEATEQPSEGQPPLVVAAETESAAEEPVAVKKNGKPKRPAYLPLAQRAPSAIRQAIKQKQDKSLRDLIDSFGPGAGSYQIKVERKNPESCFDHISGRTFDTVGHCGKYENQAIDEEYIEKHFGGGVYEVKFYDTNGAGWQFAGQVTIKIPGDPNLASYRAKAGITHNGTAQQQQSQPAEHPSIIKDAMAMVNDQLKRAEDRASAKGDNSDVIELMREQLAGARSEAAELRAEIRALANKPAPAPPQRNAMEEKMFEALLEGDSARVTNLRTTQESELRQLKESHRQDLERMDARHDRSMQDMKNAHERELATIRASHEVAMMAAKNSHEVQLAAANASFMVQKQSLESENKRLDKDNDQLRAEVKDLRAKKELGPVEMAKAVETYKNAFGVGDEDETSTGAKIVEAITNPATWDGIGSVIGQFKPPAAPPAQAQAQTGEQGMEKAKRQIVVNKQTGEKYLVMPDGTLKGPLKKKPEAKAASEGGAAANDEAPAEVPLPTLDPGASAAVIAFMESAFSGHQDPEIFAQGARSRVPEEWFNAIRDHGVDAVMTKMAKLSSTSPLSSQLGRNWVRKVGKALVGE